jgi:hypothetical protein
LIARLRTRCGLLGCKTVSSTLNWGASGNHLGCKTSFLLWFFLREPGRIAMRYMIVVAGFDSGIQD